jgi:hypothetical protein
LVQITPPIDTPPLVRSYYTHIVDESSREQTNYSQVTDKINPPTHMASRSGSPDSHASEELLRNSADESTPWVVQKYGGTSVGKSLDSICRIVE